MSSYNAQEGQTLFDVCLNTYGTLDLLSKLLIDNNISNIDVVLTSGQEFTWDETLSVNSNANVVTIVNTNLFSTGEVNNKTVIEQVPQEFSNEFSLEFN